jgi:hypothetical protein
MDRVLDDTGTGGKRNDFELCVAYILPQDPVVRRRSNQEKRQSAEIGSATVRHLGQGNGAGAATGYKPSGKKGIGSTGVHLRYHKPEEYSKLTPAQRKELQDWRSHTKHTASNKKAKYDKDVSSAVAMQISALGLKKSVPENGTSKVALKAFIISDFADNVPGNNQPTVAAVVAEPEPKTQQVSAPNIYLAQIIKQANNTSTK